MIGLRLTRRDRRALLLGLAVLAPAVLYGSAVRPYANALADARRNLHSQRDLLARELTLLADARAFPAHLERIESALEALAPRLFTAPDPVAATGVLAGYVADAAQRSRVLLERSDPASPSQVDGDLARLEVQVRALGDLEGLLALLYALEHGPKLVRVEGIAIERASRPGRQLDARDEEVLSLRAVVAGFAPSQPSKEGGEVVQPTAGRGGG